MPPPPPTPRTSSPADSIHFHPDELVAYSFAGEESLSPAGANFIAHYLAATPFTNPLPFLVPLLLAPLSILLLFTLSAKTEMAGFLSFIKSLLLPALLAAILYALFSFIIIPLYRRHRARYSQYLPVHTNPIASLSSSTQTLRQRVSGALLTFLLPSRWAEWRHRQGGGGLGNRHRVVVDARDDGDEELGETHHFDLGDESMDDEDYVVRGRRDGLSLSMDARSRSSSGPVESDRRLSRELEEGFADSSGDEDEEDRAPAQRRGVQ